MDPPIAPTFKIKEVILTNHSATEQKLQAIQCGYFKDDFAALIARLPQPVGGSPLIRRGYYARVKLVEKAIQLFQREHRKYQILSLGAGYDSSYFRMKQHNQIDGCSKWIEIDFPEVINIKNKNITQSRELFEPLIDNVYTTIGSDLRDPELGRKLKEVADSSLPVLVISECVLNYLPPEDGNTVITTVTDVFDSPVGFLSYEQINPSDKFGLMMVQNLNDRGCSLLSIHKFPSLTSQENRYKDLGYSNSTAKTMNSVWASLPDDVTLHANKTEMLDELEEWHLIHDHYMFVCSEKRMDGWCSSVFNK